MQSLIPWYTIRGLCYNSTSPGLLTVFICRHAKIILYRCFIPDSSETRHDRREIMVLKSGELDKLILWFCLILQKKIIQPSIDLLSIGIWCKYIAVQKPFVFELNMFLFCLKHLFVSLRYNRLFWHSHRGINNLFMLHLFIESNTNFQRGGRK